jgi:arylsulfatase A-like enzyme
VVAELEGGYPRTLFEKTLDPSRHGSRWHDARVDLKDLSVDVIDGSSSQELRISLETQTELPVDFSRGFSFWANPELLVQQKEQVRPNVILISIDTLRADHLSAYGYPHQTSPNIDSWAAESAVLFQTAVAQAPWTLPSHASIFSGLDALHHGVNHSDSVTTGLEMLPETLRRAGYSTAAITGGGYFRPKFGFSQGFDTYKYWNLVGSDEQLARNTEELFDWLDGGCCRPFFLFFHTYEVHYPYRKRQPYYSRLWGQEPALESRGEIVRKLGSWKLGARRVPEQLVLKQPGKPLIEGLTDPEKMLVSRTYDSSIAYVDDQLGSIFRRLEELGLRDKTVIVLTSDHGEALGEDGRSGHEYLDESNLLVPLIMEFPDGRGAGQVVGEQVRSIDIAPTILDYLGLAPPLRQDGVSLLPVLAGDTSKLPGEAWTYAASTNYGLALRYQNRLKYTFNNSAWSVIAGAEELYDLQRGLAEVQDLSENQARIESLRRLSAATFERGHKGLRMRIRNHSQGRLSGSLRGPWAVVERVKVVDASCQCLDWKKGGRARFALAPGQEVTLFFEGISGGPFSIQGALKMRKGLRVPFEEDFDLKHLREGKEALTFFYSKAGWHLGREDEAVGDETAVVEETGAGDETRAVGFRIWQVGEQETITEAPTMDRETEEQLRALGYIG